MRHGRWRMLGKATSAGDGDLLLSIQAMAQLMSAWLMLGLIWVENTVRKIALSLLTQSLRVLLLRCPSTATAVIILTSTLAWSAVFPFYEGLVRLWGHTRWLYAINVDRLLNLLVQYNDLCLVFIVIAHRVIIYVVVTVLPQPVDVPLGIFVTQRLVLLISEVMGDVLSNRVIVLVPFDIFRVTRWNGRYMLLDVLLLLDCVCWGLLTVGVKDLVMATVDFHIFRRYQHVTDWLKFRRYWTSTDAQILGSFLGRLLLLLLPVTCTILIATTVIIIIDAFDIIWVRVYRDCRRRSQWRIIRDRW